MVLVKMLMKIDPLPMRGSLVMISPSWREVSPGEQLQRSPRFVPPRFRLVATEFRPVSLLVIFFQGKRLHIAGYGHRRATRGPSPTLLAKVWAPSSTFFAKKFLLNQKMTFVEFQDFWSCAE